MILGILRRSREPKRRIVSTPSSKLRLRILYEVIRDLFSRGNEDNYDYFQGDINFKNCDCLAKKPDERCSDNDDELMCECADTCNPICENKCTNNEHYRQKGIPERNCDWIAQDPRKRCPTFQNEAFYGCPEVCNPACGHKECKNNELYLQNRLPKRACGWIARNPEKRCPLFENEGFAEYPEVCDPMCASGNLLLQKNKLRYCKILDYPICRSPSPTVRTHSSKSRKDMFRRVGYQTLVSRLEQINSCSSLLGTNETRPRIPSARPERKSFQSDLRSPGLASLSRLLRPPSVPTWDACGENIWRTQRPSRPQRGSESSCRRRWRSTREAWKI